MRLRIRRDSHGSDREYCVVENRGGLDRLINCRKEQIVLGELSTEREVRTR